MVYTDKRADGLKIAYIGGGSRGWAWGLMSDLVSCDDISGEVCLYDIDFEAAQNNEIIGNKFNEVEGAKSTWHYRAVRTLQEALTGADFVVISILPGTFDEMQSDVHTPEKYGIYQPVGDTTGPGGIIRALRTIPMFEEIGLAIKAFAPRAWVINYTNPMTICTRTLYRVFPEIRAFGCCHEVFGTQKLLMKALAEMRDVHVSHRNEIKVNVVGVNHFTWVTEATYHDMDLFPVFAEYCEKYKDIGVNDNWANSYFASAERIKMDLFRRYGVMGAAGDRHLAEFCEGSWYVGSPENVAGWFYRLTPVEWRKRDLQKRLQKSADRISGAEEIVIKRTGEEGVNQIRALLGLFDLVTNVNLPNVGQIGNLPREAVVETNASFRAGSLKPVMAGDLPMSIYPLISRIVAEQELVVEAGLTRNLELAFRAFCNDPLVNLPVDKSRALFNEMIENTKGYLGMYNI